MDMQTEDSKGGMGGRGVTRHAMHHDGEGDGDMKMSRQDRLDMQASHHAKTLWVWWAVLLLGLWLILAPLTFDYLQNAAVPSGGRAVWLSLDARAAAMFWSDLLSGGLLVVLGWRLLTPGRPVTQWLACFVGIWLQFAPLVFWSPSALAYLNDTFVGVLVIALTILIPGMPNMIVMMKMGTQIPPGWTYSPSSWPQRAVMIGLGFAGWMVSRYLAAYQLGYIPHPFDPIFGEGSRLVLDSKLSHAWPVSDGGLGAFSYTFEFLMGWMGGAARWRTMPWMVLFFGILVVPLGLTHVFLVSSMPIMVGHWCALCLLAALIMLPMIPLTLDEVVAMVQFMHKAVWREGKPFWRTFWKGGDTDGPGTDDRAPAMKTLPQNPLAIYRAGVWGMSVPWNLAIIAALGVWVMAAGSIFGTTPPAYTGIYLGGVLTVVVAVCCMAEVARVGRYLIAPVGLWLVVAPFLLGGAGAGATVNGVLCGLAVAALCLPRGKVLERYGTWDRWVV